MYSFFSSLRIKDLYMFRALLAHPQEVLHERHLVYCVRVMLVGCIRIGVKLVQLRSLWFHCTQSEGNLME
jgi:hypothetical protein